MDVDTEEIFNASYERTLGFHAAPNKADAVLSDFYDCFMSSSALVREKFKNTDMDRQQRMLRQSIVYLVNYFATGNVNDFLHRIAVMHDRSHRNIEPELYDLWLEALLQTIAEHDPYYKPEVANAWRKVLAPGIDYMKSLYAVDSGAGDQD